MFADVDAQGYPPGKRLTHIRWRPHSPRMGCGPRNVCHVCALYGMCAQHGVTDRNWRYRWMIRWMGEADATQMQLAMYSHRPLLQTKMERLTCACRCQCCLQNVHLPSPSLNRCNTQIHNYVNGRMYVGRSHVRMLMPYTQSGATRLMRCCCRACCECLCSLDRNSGFYRHRHRRSRAHHKRDACAKKVRALEPTDTM